MGLLYRLSLQHIRFVFARGIIMKTNFPKREFDWSVLNNVVLKDYILTLDFKNNKLVQAEIENKDVDEKEFNSFAAFQLQKVERPGA
jgi:hypothetical protein